MTNFFIDENKIEEYKAEFAATQCVFFPGLLAEKALQKMLAKLTAAQFYTKLEQHGENQFGKVIALNIKDPALFIFLLMMNDLTLFKKIEEITGCETIGNFYGRIHRSKGGEEHEIKWHGDNIDTRIIGMTMSLGTTRYGGGKFQLRKKNEEHLLREFGQIEAGDAFMFRISSEMQHRLTTVEEGERTVGVGWFRTQPDHSTFAKEYLKPF